MVCCSGQNLLKRKVSRHCSYVVQVPPISLGAKTPGLGVQDSVPGFAMAFEATSRLNIKLIYRPFIVQPNRLVSILRYVKPIRGRHLVFICYLSKIVFSQLSYLTSRGVHHSCKLFPYLLNFSHQQKKIAYWFLISFYHMAFFILNSFRPYVVNWRLSQQM